MKSKFTLLVIVLLFVGFAYGQTTKTVGSNGADYQTLKIAFDAINAGTITGTITLQIIDNTTETASAVLNGSGSGSASYTSVTIYPTVTGKTISGNLAAPLIDLNGADNVIIDGRINATGTSKNLVVTNTSSGTAASTIRFINSAENNTVKYCTIKGSETSASTSTVTGIIFFSTASAGNGNDANTIDNNAITSDAAGRATHGIHSKGSSGFENSGNIFSNNAIFDYLNTTLSSCGIHLDANTTSCTISGNSFYETTSFMPASDKPYSFIQINNATGSDFTVSGNYIGGTAPECGGSALTKTSANNNVFYGINLNVGTSPASSVQNNSIKNIAWSNSGAASWTGIQVTVGAVNIGTTGGNTIGAASGTVSITVTGGASGTNIYGINIAGSGAISIQNNTIGSITAANSGNAYATNFYGINRTNTGISTISFNTIGSAVTANSISASSNSTANPQNVYGIFNTTGGTFNATNNTIDNLTNSASNSDAVSGINGIASTYGINSITDNTIRNLSIANGNSASTIVITTYSPLLVASWPSVCGIAVNSTNLLNTISGNTVYNLSNTNASFAGSVVGLYFGSTGVNHTVSSNFIHNLSVNTSSPGASVYGIKINTGNTTYANNIISLGGNTTSAIYGIYEPGIASNNNSLYYNTVYIGGAPVSGSLNSFALYSAASANTRNFRNNIFNNARSNSGATGKHYAAYFDYSVATSLTLDYNDYYAPGTGGMLGYYNATDQSGLPIISGLNAKGLAIDPGLANAAGTNAVDYKSTSVKLEGTTISNILTDYASINRASTPTMGAFEGSLSLNFDVYKSDVYQATYSTLRDAFIKINNGTHTGALEVRIKANTTEAASAVLYQSGYILGVNTSNYSSVIIYPTQSGILITGNFDATLIDLNGGDNVIIDGRVNRTGTTADMEIKNINTGSFASAIRFIGSAESNTIRYCNLKSSCNSVGVGMINFTSSTTGNGNDNNIIEYCNITNSGSRPVNAIFSSGSTGRENSGNIIRNNNIHNFFSAGSTSFGVNISSNTTNWTFSGNSFYDTETITPTGVFKYFPISINTGTHTVSNNYIGGTAPNCGGTQWTINSNTSHYFCGIYINGPISSASEVSNNTISNLNYTSIIGSPWDGICVNSGNVNVTANTIGSSTGNGSILLTNSTATATSFGIRVSSTGTVNISNNSIGSITTVGASAISHSFNGISKSTFTGTLSITNNLIGSTSTSGSIQASSASTSSTAQSVHGIYSNNTGTTTISNNTVSNLYNAYAYQYATNGQITGITTGSGINTIQNNTVRDLSSSTPCNNSTFNAAVIGIVQKSTTTGHLVSDNTIYNLMSTYTGTRDIFVIGIHYSGANTGTNTVANNFIHSLSLSASSVTSTITGIRILSGNCTYANNIINLGSGISAGYFLFGIYENSTLADINRINFNTIYLSGNRSGNTSSTYALFNNNNLSTKDIRNNILYNAVTGGSTGKHYAIHLAGTTNTTIDYNDYFITGTGSVLGSLGTLDIADLTAWKAGTIQDLNSLSTDPIFTIPGGTSALNYYTSAVLPGISIAEVTTDFDGLTRGSTPKMGALEANNYVWLGTASNDFATSANWSGGVVPLEGANIAFAANPSNHCVLDQDRSFKNITNAQPDDDLVTNGHQLTISGILNFTGGAQIDATSVSSSVVFAGSLAQSIPAGSFVNNTVDGLTINNGTGLTLNGDLAVSQTLTLTNGALSIGSNTLTLNGALTPVSGTLTGGATSNLAFGGSGVSTNLPAITLNNFTINRANGISLGGDINVGGTLALTVGILTVNGNALTITGNSIVRTTGSIDAANSLATVIFENTSAIALPASVFTGDIQQLTINTSSGITAASDFAIKGNLHLNAANPSATKGLLDMDVFVLEMKDNATTSGIGDVTGRIVRNSIAQETIYSFGNPNTTIRFYDAGLLPTQLKFIVRLVSSPVKPEAVLRYYEVIQTGVNETTPTKFSLQLHYLDSELNGNIENNLVFWDHHVPYTGTTPHEHGRTDLNTDENWILLSGHSIRYLALYEYNNLGENTPTKLWMISETESLSGFVWTGAVNSNWDLITNWTGSEVPTSTSNVLIPANTGHPALLPDDVTREVKTIAIQPGGQLIGGSNSILNITGALDDNNGTVSWENDGYFTANNTTVIFNNANAAIIGTTDFYNLSIPADMKLTLLANATVGILNTLSANGTLDAFYEQSSTLNYKGDLNQTVISPKNGEYYNLILSGSGTKTMPVTAMSMLGDFTVDGTASATAGNSLNIDGNVSIGTNATLGTGTFSHQLKGNLTCDGTLSPGTGSMITMNGSSAQNIQGGAATIALGGLTVSNTNGIILFNHATTAALDISSGAFTVTAGKSLTASGATTLGSALCLVLKSDETGTASFIDNGSISGTGTARIERYITPYDVVSDLKFHFLSSPVSSTQAISTEFIDLSSELITDFYKWDEPTNYWINFRGSSYNLQNTSFGDGYNFVPGKGYLVAYPTAVTKNFVGTPNTSSAGISIPCTKTASTGYGWNLIGNPYPSSIDWSTGITKTGIDAALYYYDNATPSYKYYSDFSGGLGGASKYIAPMQGFMVHATSNGSVVISNTARTHEGQNVFYKSASLSSNILDLKVEGNSKTDYARVCFYDQATENFDGEFDAYKLFSYSANASELYSVTADNTSMAINTLPETVMEGGSVPVSFKPGSSGDFTLTAERINSFDAGITITLEDKATDTWQKLNDKQVYVFQASPQDATDRFVLHFANTTSVSETETVNPFNISIVSGVVNVGTASAGLSGKVKVTDMTGRTIAVQNLVSGVPTRINLKATPGVYVVSVYTSKNIYSRKVVVY